MLSPLTLYLVLVDQIQALSYCSGAMPACLRVAMFPGMMVTDGLSL